MPISRWQEPECYNPDHFVNHPLLAPGYAGTTDYMNREDHYVYGAGRRICAVAHNGSSIIGL
ncbi:hypothetical protein EYZ11_007103 [Aspergillus tanneri]|uniref:Uncharacterized protein n=1 Tax=Aspergillus tanneri TaxID=1220188 RepID=A0A4S3JG54_9EURO|nr:hypothetical protein EYZ11_007103 [Aspergillus tanneri]